LKKRLAARPSPPPRDDGGINRNAIAAFEALLAGRFQPRDVATLLVGPERGGDDPVKPEITLLRPVATFVRDAHPTLEARPLGGATEYKVTLTNPDTGRTLPTVSLSSTRWKAAETLQRGQVYEWQVTARSNGRNVQSPYARFAVLETEKANALTRAERANAGRHLTLGVLYAQAGLLDDAEREIAALLKADPQHAAARDLLRELRAKRPR